MKKLANISKMCQSISRLVDENEIKASLLNQKDQIKEEILYLEENKGQVAELLNILFPQGIAADYEFYETLSKIPPCLEFEEPSDRLIGILWSGAYQQIPSPRRENFLSVWVDKESSQFWDYVYALPTFLSNVEISTAFASNWFLKIGNAVKGNLAGGDFFRGVENYAFNFPSAGLTVLDQYVKDGLDNMRLHLAAIILGAVRAKSEKENVLKETVNKWDVEARQKTELRRCYYRSWTTSFRRGGISTNKLSLVLDKAIEGTIEEQNEAFDIVRRCSSRRVEEEFARFVFQWLNKHVSSELSSDAKYSIADTVYKLRDCQGKNRALIDTADANKLILSIQPIKKEYANIWEKMEYYLVHRLRENTDNFGKLIKQVADKNPETFIELFIDRKLEYLISEMNRIGISQLITDCIFSTSDIQRRLGNVLLQRISIETLSDTVMKVKHISDKELRLALWESIRMPSIDGKKTARFLLMMESLVRNTSDNELRNEFENEMVLQAINYPGVCLKEWKKIEKPSDLLKRVIAKAEGYFEKQKELQNSPANSFQFPEYMETIEKERRGLSQRFLETRDQSLVSQIFPTVDLIYGDLLAQGEKGEIGEPRPLEELPFQVKTPRLERLQPESMALRRFEAEQRIRHLRDGEI